MATTSRRDNVTLAATAGMLSGVTDNDDGTYTATLTSATTAGTARVTGTVNGVSITDDAAVEFTPGPADPSRTTADVPDGTAGNPTVITVTTRDANGNPLTAGGDAVVVSVTGSNTATPGVTDNGDGTYTAQYTPTVPGNDLVAITLNGTAISGSPYTSTVQLAFTAVSAGGLFAGSGHTCGVTTGGAAWCWGAGGSGQLGNGSMSSSTAPVPVTETGWQMFDSISAGESHVCGLTPGGEAWCWGAGGSGELGNGSTSNSTVPVPVSGGLTFESISAGDAHTCGVTAGGAAYCWGSNIVGALGDGTTTDRLAPVPVSGGLTFAAVSAGQHTCGVTASGEAWCWGRNNRGQLGDGTTTQRNSPVPVSGGLTFAGVDAGLIHTCGVTTGGDAWCWGSNDIDSESLVPRLVQGVSMFATGSAGRLYSCGVTTTGAAWCWGDNESGQIGNGSTSLSLEQRVPALVSGGLTFATVSADGTHTCGVTTAGAAWCWGDNSSGELGNPTAGTTSNVPVLVSGSVP
jgi:alpha-tubulin suppressor-like RCC1 family protein